ncbi:uncharacterized protein [Periplaneta americana]|uniref:uncharacterized protein n=1 Tax=Periplaneta americana TaxID=6978 RepID=UPI0037E99709
MPLYNQPVRLQKLSLESLAKYLSDICVRLVNSGGNSEASSKDAIAICQRLQRIIHESLPFSMANCITSVGLKHLDDRYNDIRSCTEDSSCMNILQHFIKILLHPQVTELDIANEWNYISNIILNEIERLSQLRVLRFCVRNEQSYRKISRYDVLKKFPSQCLYSLKNLKCFILPAFCSDEIISVLSKSATGLTHLDVNRSSGVTDASIDIILNFPHLQSLNISETGISVDGYTCLLDTFENHCRLQEFGFSLLNTSQIRSLAQWFPGVRRLSLIVDHSMRPHLNDTLQLLKGLEELKVSGNRSISMPSFANLKVLETLKVLELDVRYVDVQHLQTNCPRLEKLHIKTMVLKCPQLLGSFRYLYTLSIWTVDSDPISAILSATPNLVTLYLFTTLNFYNDISAMTLFSQSLNLLENLFMGSHTGYIRPDTLSLIARSCPRLTRCSVFGRRYNAMKSSYRHCAGVHLLKYRSVHTEMAYIPNTF